jgi:hypothetical protein
VRLTIEEMLLNAFEVLIGHLGEANEQKQVDHTGQRLTLWGAVKKRSQDYRFDRRCGC